MPYITSVERRGLEKGLQQGLQQGKQENILQLLEIRFEDVAQELKQIIEKLDDIELLGKLFAQAATTQSLDEFESVVSQYVTDDESKEEEE
ncbi:MAG: hypothetical protein F6K31_19815 [Symploca sp. SIO2G7]|nr:hypothetical protein [Symploca sp. SIO2G7]